MAFFTLTTLAITGAALAVAGAATSGVAGIVEGKQQSQMAEYNAKLQKQQASQAIEQSRKEALAKEQDTRERLKLEREQQGSMKATIRNQGGINGIVETSGTSLQLQIKNAENMEFNNQQMWRAGQIEANDIRYRGELNAWGHNVAASQYKTAASNAEFGGWMNSTASFMGAAGNAALMAYSIKDNKGHRRTPGKPYFLK